ncbi:hypothetical protein IMCC3317_11780 [Kordia antarctica]|uniref:Uncharacterized protein n=1 Tax=Kordia antarctica TaxID=1218801 RepID=A0A7L4ZH24_9FLAO|nr:hypothetical protein [Kordia antarctica]QHI35830.1 hypothetical protein IMCC3317_11780 [Kordia antarctica]
MKKKHLKGLALNKKSVSDLSPQNVVGGKFTGGCTDGCTPYQTVWNCTRGGDCSADCNNGNSNICPVK